MMLRVLLLVIVSFALLSALIGYLGTRVMPSIDRTLRTDLPGEVVSASWPSVTLKSGDRTWKLKYWPLHPRFQAGEEVTIALGKNDDSAVSLHDVGDWPLRYLALGGIIAIISIFVLAATGNSAPEIPSDAMPQFPVTLHEPRFVAYLFLVFGSICVIGSITALIFISRDVAWYYYLNYIGGLVFGALLAWGGVHLVSGTIVVTETEIVETSRVAKLSVALDQVKWIEQVPIYGEKLNRRLSGPDPIVGWTLVFRGKDGSELYKSSTNLKPRENYKKVVNYLVQRFPFETRR